MSARWTEEELAAYQARQQHRALDDLEEEMLTQQEAQQSRESEAKFMTRVIALAKTQGALVYHTYRSDRSEKGFPDLCIVTPPKQGRPEGLCIFAELKAERGKLTKEQQLWVSMLQTVPGVQCYVWRPSQFEEIRVLLS